jgi:outer membrane translocation and assembly module TamA
LSCRFTSKADWPPPESAASSRLPAEAYDPERQSFLVTFKIEEGRQYRVGAVHFESSIPTLDGNALRSFSRVNVGSVYNAEELEKSVEEMQIEAPRRGYAFAIVRPRGDRNFEAHTVSIAFSIDEGPRTYIERINVRGKYAYPGAETELLQNAQKCVAKGVRGRTGPDVRDGSRLCKNAPQ